MDTIINVFLGLLVVVMLVLLVWRRKKLKSEVSDEKNAKSSSVDKNESNINKPSFISSIPNKKEHKNTVTADDKKTRGPIRPFGIKNKNNDQDSSTVKSNQPIDTTVKEEPVAEPETYKTMLLDQDKTMPLDDYGNSGINLKLTDINENKVVFDKSINQSIVIGRKDGCDIMFNESSISKEHASLSIIEGNVWVSDLFSTNGTFLNGTKLEDTTVMNSGDLIKVGRREMKVEIG